VFAGATLAGACWTSSAPRTTPVEQDRRVVETKESAIAAGSIRGFVRDGATGAPLAGIAVMLHGDDGRAMRGISDENGEYVFAGLPPGTYTITYQPNHPRHAPTNVTVTLTGDTGQRADLSIFVPAPQQHNIPMPYGAPPARRRIV
jgi:hypothetical protein